VSLWLSAAASVAGALLAFVGARLGVRAELAAVAQRDEQSRREEWGRRFAGAVALIVDGDHYKRNIGLGMLAALRTDELATGSDGQLAEWVLSVSAEPPAAPSEPLDDRAGGEDTVRRNDERGGRE
jgi:hypothetical protein